MKGNYGEVLFLYNGQYGVQSDDSGLYYMRARYYNAAIKRFINQDTVTGSIESSQSLNRYAYVEGNPVSYLDPFGLEKFDTSWIHTLVLCMDISFAATGVILLATGNVLAVLRTATLYAEVSKVLSLIDTIAYVYDFITADNDEDRAKAVMGIAINQLGEIIKKGVFSLTDITKVYEKEQVNQIDTIIGYVYSTLSDSSNSLIDEIMEAK